MKHGMSGTRIHLNWCEMRQRCNNPNSKDYHNYGGRGIKICEEWDEFMVFYNWAITHGYNEDLSLDRKDNNLGYNPENCRWATRIEQGNNRRTNTLIEIDGKLDTIANWARLAGITRFLMRQRYVDGKRGKDLLKPARKRCKQEQ